MNLSFQLLTLLLLVVGDVECATYTFSGIIVIITFIQNGNTPVTNYTFIIPISSQVAACIFRMPSSSHRNVLMMAR